MEGAALQLQQQFEVIYCCTCGMPFAVPAKIRGRWLDNGAWFYCPRGHQQHYADSEVERLRKRTQALERQAASERKRHEWTREELRITEYRRRAEKAAKTRIRNRVARGTCPCCKRHFENLQRHMAAKHPELVEQVKGGGDADHS